MYRVNITEQMVDIPPQMVITKDKLNAQVDAVVYYQIKDVKASIYNVDDHRRQLTSLARTTLRAVVGNMTLTNANEKRSDINEKVESVLDKETSSYGVEVLRVEIQKIEPPEDVQDSMNKVVKAEQEKIAAMDMATAAETRADGEKRAEIKRAEGVKRGLILSVGIIRIQYVPADILWFRRHSPQYRSEGMIDHSERCYPPDSPGR